MGVESCKLRTFHPHPSPPPNRGRVRKLIYRGKITITLMRNVIFFMGLLLAGNAFAATLVDVELSASRDNNISRAENSADVKTDNILGLGISLQRAWLLSPSSGVLLRGNVKFDQFQHYTDLSHITANVGATYRLQPVVGYSAPMFDFGLALEKDVFRDSDIRDGAALQADVAVSSHVTDRIHVRGGLGLEKRWADTGNVFEWQRLRGFVGGDYKVSAGSTLYASASRTEGDQVFTSSSNPAILSVAQAVANDPVFGARRAYRLGATADVLELGDSMVISSNTTLDLGLRYFTIDADGDHSYDGTELRVSWLYRFR